MTFLSFKENSKYQLRQMVLEWTAEILQKADFTNIGSQPQRTQKKKVSNGRREEKKSQSANYRMILWELAPTDCGLGSVVPLIVSHTNQLCNRILQRKLKFLTPTVCQRVVVCFFFLNPTVGHRSQVFSWLLFSCCQFGGQRGKCVSDSYVLQVHARLNCLQNARAWDL